MLKIERASLPELSEVRELRESVDAVTDEATRRVRDALTSADLDEVAAALGKIDRMLRAAVLERFESSAEDVDLAVDVLAGALARLTVGALYPEA